MSYLDFKRWADKRGLSRAEKDQVILAATRKGKDISNMEEDEWEKIAREVGIVLGTIRRFWGWLRGLF